MLKRIDPLLSPDLLMVLRAMGHGDEIAIVDGNYPADAHARRLVRLPGISATRALDAILSVMPLDDFVPVAAFHPDVVAETAGPAVFAEFREIVTRQEGAHFVLGSIAGEAFYDRVKACYAIVGTDERRLYGNIILRKGVIRPGT